MGAHRAVHLTDRAMAGSDTLATARSLALALGREEFALILCGRNSNDAETGQVGPEIAELLHVPFVGNVRKLDYERDLQSVVAERETEDGYELIRCPLPALVSVTEGLMEERWPSRQEMEAARQDPAIEELGAAQLSPDSSLFGAAGSPTSVAGIRVVESQRLGVVIEEPDPLVAAERLIEGLKRRNAHSTTTAAEGHFPKYPGPKYPGNRERAIWVVAERAGPVLRRASFELLGKAAELVEHTRSEVAAILIGRGNEDDVKALAAYGADRVLIMEGPSLGHPRASPAPRPSPMPSAYTIPMPCSSPPPPMAETWPLAWRPGSGWASPAIA